jgi:hypothetical protein
MYPNIKLESSAMSSNEEAVAKIQAGFEVDMVNACVDEAALEMVRRASTHRSTSRASSTGTTCSPR